MAWTVSQGMQYFKGELRGRSFENGKKMFAAGRCVACHRIQGSGGYSGPDLGSVGKRYSIEDILKSICEPSATISDQYTASEVTLKDGSGLYGRIIFKNDQETAIATNPFNFGQLTNIPTENIKEIQPSSTSLMPPGMINGMNPEELQDLMAYLLSGGNRRHVVFK